MENLTGRAEPNSVPNIGLNDDAKSNEDVGANDDAKLMAAAFIEIAPYLRVAQRQETFYRRPFASKLTV